MTAAQYSALQKSETKKESGSINHQIKAHDRSLRDLWKAFTELQGDFNQMKDELECLKTSHN